MHLLGKQSFIINVYGPCCLVVFEIIIAIIDRHRNDSFGHFIYIYAYVYVCVHACADSNRAIIIYNFPPTAQHGH